MLNGAWFSHIMHLRKAAMKMGGIELDQSIARP